MADDRHLLRRAIIAFASSGLLVAGGILAARSTATGHLSTATLPAEVQGHTALATPSSTAAPRALVPVWLEIPISSTHHPHGVRARVTAHPLDSDGSLYVPADPHVVNWASNDAAPGSDHGTTIIAGHINFVIDDQTVNGALADVSEYARSAIGATLTLGMSSGITLRYRIVAGREYAKDELADDPRLRARLYDQSSAFGSATHPTGRLLLVSCGGAFDPTTGEYEDNVFLYALPAS